MLFYEILRSEDVINKLGDLTGVTGLAQQTTSPRASADQNQHRPSVSATDSVKNLKAVIAHFGTALDEHREAKGTSSLVEADEVVEILARSAERGARLDLVESTNLENVRSVFMSFYSLLGMMD